MTPLHLQRLISGLIVTHPAIDGTPDAGGRGDLASINRHIRRNESPDYPADGSDPTGLSIYDGLDEFRITAEAPAGRRTFRIVIEEIPNLA